MNGSSICYILVVLASAVLVVYGFMDILKRKSSEDVNDLEVIQRQIRGFAMIMLAQVVLVLGLSGCIGMSGGLAGIAKMLRPRNIQKAVSAAR